MAKKVKRRRGRRGHQYNEARKRWEARLTVGYADDGRQIRKLITAGTEDEIKKLLAEARLDLDAGIVPLNSHDTLARHLERWLTDVLPGTVSAGTLTNYRNVANTYVIPHIGHVPLDKLTPQHVRGMLRKLEATVSPRTGRPLSDNTLRLARSVLRRALRFAETEGLVSGNVAALTDPIRRQSHDETERRFITVDQGRQILAHVAGTRHEAAFTTLLLVGLRRGELLGLEWSDIDFDANRLTVRQQLRKHERSRPGEPVFAIEACKTRQSRRTLAMPAPVAQSLRRHRTAQLSERLAVPDWEEAPLRRDLVFRNHSGAPLHPDTLRHYCYRMTEEALGERFSPHDLRHAAASFALEAGVPIPRISEMMGHSSIRVTLDVYAHLFTEGKDDTAAAMGALFAAQT